MDYDDVEKIERRSIDSLQNILVVLIDLSTEMALYIKPKEKE